MATETPWTDKDTEELEGRHRAWVKRKAPTRVGGYVILHGECIEHLMKLESGSVDALVTDPPYFLTNSGGSGFMGKEWDSLSPASAIAESYFRLARLDLNMVEGAAVLANASTPQIEESSLSRKNTPAQSAERLSQDHRAASNPSTSSAHELVITKAEALALCKEWLPSLTELVEKLPSHARFVGASSLTDSSTHRSIARIIADTLLAEPAWLASAITFISTEKTENEKGSSGARSGTSPENRFTSATSGLVENAGSSAADTPFSVITSSPTEFRAIISRITSLPSVKRVISECTKSPSFIPVLSEVFHRRWAREVFRVLKPGAHGVVFGGTRTYHRLASALEDEGFFVRDLIVWVHGQGFPKSLNIEKAGTGEAWAGWGTALKPALEPIALIRKPLSEKNVAANVLRHGTGAINIDGCRVEGVKPLRETTHDKKGLFGMGSRLAAGTSAQGRFPANLIVSGTARDLMDEQSGTLKTGTHTGKRAGLGYHGGSGTEAGAFVRESNEGGASRFFFDGADYPPFYYCAKPSKREKNAGTKGVLTWENTGQSLAALMDELNQLAKGISGDTTQLLDDKSWSTDLYGHRISEQYPPGLMSTIETTIRLITDLRTSNSSQSSRIKESILAAIRMIEANGLSLAESAERLSQLDLTTTRGETASLLGVSRAALQTLSRIRELAKRGNVHSTVKPLKLMRYLCRLITPPGGLVLDPFAGSGTTGVAAIQEGFRFIGIEREAEYVEIARARIEHAAKEAMGQERLPIEIEETEPPSLPEIRVPVPAQMDLEDFL